MSASSPFPSSDIRTNRWKHRKTLHANSTSRRHRPDDDDDDDDEEDDPVVEEEDDEDVEGSPAAAPPPSATGLESEILSDGAARISDFPSVVRHPVNCPHPSVLAIVSADRAVSADGFRSSPPPRNPYFLENISHGQLQALSSIPSDSTSLASTPNHDRSDAAPTASYVCTPPPIMEGKGIIKRFGNQRSLVIPMHSDWLSLAMVNRLERQVVPHFFSGKSADHSPEKYLELRNKIVAKYMESPEKQLLVGDCQGLVANVELQDLVRIVRFLDHWGIINYMAATQHGRKIGSLLLREDVNGEVHVQSSMLRSIDSLISFNRPKSRLRPDDVASLGPVVGDSDLDRKIRERLAENRCNCCTRPLPHIYYQSQKEADIMLCSECFHNGRFVAGNSSIDFVRVDSMKDLCDLDGDNWTDQETLLLLEALELYSDNWNEIAEHVGTKSKAQCILHFIRLPMEDCLLENIEMPQTDISSDFSKEDGTGKEAKNYNGDAEVCLFPGASPQDPDSEDRIPFANSGNPVMSLVAFLASAVGPRVAAACAHASLASLSKEENHAVATNGIAQVDSSNPGGDRLNSEGIQREDNSHGATTALGQQTDETGGAPLAAESVKAAAKAGLSAAATKAKQFADHEEREIQRLAAAIINHQLKRLELKLKQFAEVETLLMKECEQVERTRQRLSAEQARIISTRFGSAGATAQPVITAANSSNISSNVRPVVIATSSGQANFSALSNNPPTHPHMSYMPRQQMFSFGPRLPLSVLHPSSSTPTSTVMYPSPSSHPPCPSRPMLRPVSGGNSNVG